jgi:hypothetical protein
MQMGLNVPTLTGSPVGRPMADGRWQPMCRRPQAAPSDAGWQMASNETMPAYSLAGGRMQMVSNVATLTHAAGRMPDADEIQFGDAYR